MKGKFVLSSGILNTLGLKKKRLKLNPRQMVIVRDPLRLRFSQLKIMKSTCYPTFCGPRFFALSFLVFSPKIWEK